MPPPPESPRAPRVVVIGGGISGLAAAAAIRRARPSYDVTVLESTTKVGGKLALAEVGGVTVDVGAESILNRRPEGVALAREAGLPVVHPATIQAGIWSRGHIREMPRSVMGVPVDHKQLTDSGLLSRAGSARASMDSVLPPTRLGETDVSVGWLVEERLGKELLDRLVEPLLGGVYAGHARDISARAAVPQLVRALEGERSLTKAAAAVVGGASSATPVFAGISGGVGRLPHAVASTHDLDVVLERTVRGLEQVPDGWRLTFGSAASPETMHADAVVLATPAAVQARLLRDAAPDAASELGQIEAASTAVVTLAFRAHDLYGTRGSGFLVPPVEGRTIKAATYSFGKWDWVAAAGGADELAVMRTSVGRHREESTLQRSDEELVEQSLADLADMIGLSSRPVDWHVQRWGGGLPQYAVGHLERIARIRAAVCQFPGLAVCGATYDGIGIPACIASAEAAATQILLALDGWGE